MKKEELKKHAGLIEKFVQVEAKKLRDDVPSTCAVCGGSAEGCSCSHGCKDCQKEVCVCEATVSGPTSMVFTVNDVKNAFEAGIQAGKSVAKGSIDDLFKEYLRNKNNF